MFSGFTLWLLTPITIFSMRHIKKYDKIQLFYVIWFFGTLPIVFLNIWRWWSFAFIPASLFSSSVITKYIEEYHDNREKKRTTNTS